MSFWANDSLGNYLSGQMSFWANVFWQMSFWANVFLGKCLLDKCPSGQMSFWANVLLAIVDLGKYLWANVSGQMSYGQISYHHAGKTYLALVV
jgi:hypothetical protein